MNVQQIYDELLEKGKQIIKLNPEITNLWLQAAGLTLSDLEVFASKACHKYTYEEASGRMRLHCSLPSLNIVIWLYSVPVTQTIVYHESSI